MTNTHTHRQRERERKKERERERTREYITRCLVYEQKEKNEHEQYSFTAIYLYITSYMCILSDYSLVFLTPKERCWHFSLHKLTRRGKTPPWK